MRPNLQETGYLVTFTEKILNGKLHFLCRVIDFKEVNTGWKRPSAERS